MAKYYLDQNGTKVLVQYINNGLDQKMDKTELANLATKQDLQNVTVNMSGYATETYVNQKIADIPAVKPYDDSELRDLIENIEAKTSGLYHFKGSVADLAALQAIENPEVGDTYNLLDTGMNAAWTGEAWDEFGSVADLTDYVKNEDVQAITRAELNAILYSGKKATVNDTESLTAMLSNSQSEVEITVNNEMSITEPIVIPEGKKVILKLDNNTISSNAVGLTVKGELELDGGAIAASHNGVVVVEGGKVTINDTDISSATNIGVSATGDGSKVVINSGNITAQEYGVGVFHGASVTVNGGYLKGLDNFGLGGNGSKYYDTVQKKVVPKVNDNTIPVDPCNVTINGGIIEGQIVSPGYIATAIYWPNAGTLTLNNCTVKGAAGIVQRGGTVNIGEGTTIIANGEAGVLGKAGDSSVTVGPYAVVFDKGANYPDAANMQLNIAANVTLQGTDGDVCKLPADATGVNDER
jgi:hypothetical protein